MNDKSDREILLAVYQDVATLKAQMEPMERLCKDYYGNGEGGTRRDVTTLKTQVGLIVKVIVGVTTAVCASVVIAILDIVRY